MITHLNRGELKEFLQDGLNQYKEDFALNREGNLDEYTRDIIQDYFHQFITIPDITNETYAIRQEIKSMDIDNDLADGLNKILYQEYEMRSNDIEDLDTEEFGW